MWVHWAGAEVLAKDLCYYQVLAVNMEQCEAQQRQRTPGSVAAARRSPWGSPSALWLTLKQPSVTYL